MATSCSGKNVDLCKSIGADLVVDYKAAPLETTLASHEKYDCFYDCIGNGWVAAQACLPSGARYITIATPLETKSLLSFGALVISAKLKSVFTGPSYTFMLMKPNQDDLKSIAQLFEEKKLRAFTDRVFPFDKALEAFEHQQCGHCIGKTIVTVDPAAAVAESDNSQHH